MAADHDGRDRVRPRLAVRSRDPVVLALVARGRARPHQPDHLDRLGELRDADGRGRVRPAVGAVLLLVPARADAEHDAPAGQRLRRRDHLGEERGVPEAVAEHLVAAELVRVARERVGEEAPSLGDLVAPVLHVIGEPERVERARGPVEVGKGVLHETRPDVEADGNGIGSGLRTSSTCRRRCAAAARRGSDGQLSARISKRRSSRYGPRPAVCGVISTPGIVHSGWSAGRGSCSNTSSPAPAISPASSAATRSSSRVVCPRPMLMKNPVRFMRAKAGAVHEALGGRRVRDGEDHEVGERQERVERVGAVELHDAGRRLAAARVHARSRACRRPREPRRLAADAAHAHDQRGGLRQVHDAGPRRARGCHSRRSCCGR